MFTILFCLGSGIVYLLKDQRNSKRMVKALSWRIGLSVFLFILLLLAYVAGYIQPNF
jgi:hypothetical protein